MEDSINVSVLIRLPSFYDITPATGFFNFLAVDVESRVAPVDTESRLFYIMEFTILNLIALCKEGTRVTIHKVDRDLTRIEIASYFSGKYKAVSFTRHISEEDFQHLVIKILNEVQ